MKKTYKQRMTPLISKMRKARKLLITLGNQIIKDKDTPPVVKAQLKRKLKEL